MLKNLNAENKMLRQKAKEVEGKYLKIPKPSTGKKVPFNSTRHETRHEDDDVQIVNVY